MAVATALSVVLGGQVIAIATRRRTAALGFRGALPLVGRK